MVSVQDNILTERVQAGIESLLRERRGIKNSKDDDFYVRDIKEIIDTLTGTTTVLTALLSAVAGVSLLVGGIGIMNIMMVSVTERTREIGIRLAIGALERDVLLQFLVESVVLASFGGLIGILVGLSTAAVIARVIGVPVVFKPGIITAAFLFSGTVGVLFGYFPARKAALLDPDRGAALRVRRLAPRRTTLPLCHWYRFKDIPLSCAEILKTAVVSATT